VSVFEILRTSEGSTGRFDTGTRGRKENRTLFSHKVGTSARVGLPSIALTMGHWTNKFSPRQLQRTSGSAAKVSIDTARKENIGPLRI